MEEISCEICFCEFNENLNIPKVLECGHSYCMTCLQSLFRHSKKCPKCNHGMYKQIIENYATNFSLLSAIDSFEDVKRTNPHLEDLIKLKKHLTKERDSLFSKILQNSDLLKLTSHLQFVDEMLNNDQIRASQKVEDKILNIWSDLETLKIGTIKEDNCPASNICDTSEPEQLNSEVNQLQEVNPKIMLSSFGSGKEFLSNIVREKIKGREVFASTERDGCTFYGRTSIHSEILLIHAFVSSSAPSTASIVKLKDLKRCVTKENFRTFLRFPLTTSACAHTVVIRLVDSSCVELFIKLCSGEDGPTYQGVAFSRGFLPWPMESIVWVYGPTNWTSFDCYDASRSEKRSFLSNSVLVERLERGGVRIFRNIGDKPLLNVVGQVVSSQSTMRKIFYGEGGKIIDSGIGFYV